MCQVKVPRSGLLTLLLSLLSLCAHAQDEETVQVIRGGCTPDVNVESTDGAITRGLRRKLPTFKKKWDANKTYRQLVMLVEFSDTVFSKDREYYDRLFNEPGFNGESRARGSVADYFRDQSNGLFNPQFDVYGPIRVNRAARVGSETDHGKGVFHDAAQKLVDSLAIDLSPYDWDGNHTVDQVVIVYAGLSGNVSGNEGFLWPNTGYFAEVNAGKYSLSSFSASSERITEKSFTGIGTICHEYSHCFGLPDIYPTNTNINVFSIVDEWDLMDGGNFCCRGWCPPSYTTLEKMLLGWYTPIELTEPTTIEGMKPVTEGGDAYIIYHTDKEYLLLENRQLSGWDSYVPGTGLLIFHVDYNESDWRNNVVNNMRLQPRFSIVCADNMSYEAWEAKVPTSDRYEGRKSRSIYMSTAPYPYVTDSTRNDALTETTTPSYKMHNMGALGYYSLRKPITNIRVSDDGLVSFDFMKEGQTPVGRLVAPQGKDKSGYYSLQGQRIENRKLSKGVYIHDGKKVIIK